LRLIAILLAPFTPISANKILDLLNVENDKRDFTNLTDFLKVGHPINEPKAVFPRLEIV
jgi:methionyl-tRNA synthetase